MRYLLFCFLLFSSNVFAARIAIIIDDIGYRQSDKAVLALPSNVTLSVLPLTPLGKTVAIQAYQQGSEILVHLPMQALNGKTIGPGALTNIMSEQDFKQQLEHAIDSVPFAIGANNHMGSLLTQLSEPMHWVMDTLIERDIYFIDSVTTKYSQAGAIAEEVGVPLLKRTIFLDNDKSNAGLEFQFQKAIELAKTLDNIVVIAHPYPETLEFLNNNLHRLAEANIALVPPSRLLPFSVATKEEAVKNPTVRLR
ncbi:divergent polysaccharide deacetylase family protein [Shewanella sp. KX20019]|uniref:divergent polysaccharide deacetylase family protein n=1 Tax=Shewanella sp. KX20019 TaxID=2803864 RepID=UPI0019289858|nr:divergent polysaccharide deacetylase family protein [Shewanella sp. KX20019]QQX80264.1 divergent polysaccharide deacetylase family protein [Shewanella sp. KX20019]